MTCFMEFLSKKKIKSRVDVYMEHLKQVSNKEIYDIEDKDVLEFLIFKHVNDSGRTVVHKYTCPYAGTTSLDHCEEVGRKGPYNAVDQLGDSGISTAHRSQSLPFSYLGGLTQIPKKNCTKTKILKYKYKNIFTIFFDASSFSVIKIIDDETKKNDKYNSLVKNINEISDSLQEYSTYQMSLSSNPTTEELVRFIIMVSNNIYNLDELDRLIKELDRYK